MQPDYLGFLHRHPDYESKIGLRPDHVIVDKPDWEAIRQHQVPPPGFVALSRRNLLTLLHMLDDPDSSKVLHKPTPAGTVHVSPVQDEEAYRNRAPGPMKPEREDFIRRMETATKAIRATMKDNSYPPTWAIKLAKALAKRGCTDDCSCPHIREVATTITEVFHREYGL